MFVVTPTINLNGTSPRELLEQQCLAIEALRAAISAVQAAAPNGRDYQTALPGTFHLAQQGHADRLARLEGVMKELEEIAQHVADHA
jgi:hypothetical protein